MFPKVHTDSLPWLNADQMREVDRIMIEDLGIELIQMMENAGRGLAELVVARFAPSSVMVLAGTGGNGGGALVAARHLNNSGVDVSVCVTSIDRLRPVPRQQFDVVTRIGIPVVEEPVSADLVIDGIIGYSLNGAPTGRSAEVIRWTHGHQVLSLDVPSGVDVTSGHAYDPSVRATATGTLAAPKLGLRDNESTGELYLLDISVPPSVYASLGFDVTGEMSSVPIARIVGRPAGGSQLTQVH